MIKFINKLICKYRGHQLLWKEAFKNNGREYWHVPQDHKYCYRCGWEEQL